MAAEDKGVFEAILPNLAFNATNLLELGDSPLLNVVFPNFMAAAAWYGGAWNKSASKIFPSPFAAFIGMKSPIQGTNLSPPIGLPGISSGRGRD
jgi:hypothetical protein